MPTSQIQQDVRLRCTAVQFQRKLLSEPQEIERCVEDTQISAGGPSGSPGSINSARGLLPQPENDVGLARGSVHLYFHILAPHRLDQTASVQPLDAFTQAGRVKHLPFGDAQFTAHQSVREAFVAEEIDPADHKGPAGIDLEARMNRLLQRIDRLIQLYTA